MSENVKLRSKLPEEDANGLKGESWRRTLVQEPRTPRVAIVIFDVDSITKTVDTNFEIPAVRLVAIEPVTDAISAGILISQLQELAAERTGQTPLAIPKEVDEESTAEPEEEQHSFIVKSLPGGKLGLYLTVGGIEVGRRGALVKSEHEDAAPGEFTFEELPESLKGYADALEFDWLSTTTDVEEPPARPEFEDPWEVEA